MKESFMLLFVFGLFLTFSSCDGDDEGTCSGIYSEGECIPDFVFPPIDSAIEGQKLYHNTYGILVYSNGNWVREDATIITKNELLIE
ncbi:hypothetical protein ACFFVB_14395 [Formosa undariae]|uniref:Uncharacterized protein n=1 Tax=Formosa undariae TaxID=1325436 RepID=A0ABV5F4F9_9FLAO